MLALVFLTNESKDRPFYTSHLKDKAILAVGEPMSTPFISKEYLTSINTFGLYEGINYDELPKITFMIETNDGKNIKARWDGITWVTTHYCYKPEEVKYVFRLETIRLTQREINYNTLLGK